MERRGDSGAILVIIMRLLPLLLLLCILPLFSERTARAEDLRFPKAGEKWCALHTVSTASDGDLAVLAAHLPELKGRGLNVVILEINYNFQFRSHPELRAHENGITEAGAREFARTARELEILVVPQFNCVGHQTDHNQEKLPLLREYPEFDLTPGPIPSGDKRHPRAYDPLNPKVNEIVFALIDELINAFEAEAFHAGMDEIFFLGHEASPSTREMEPAEVFARAVNDLHDHIVKKRGLTMMIWGDRLIDGEGTSFHAWEASVNGTAEAKDKIPKDIIVCPWHYDLHEAYPSIKELLEAGFRVLPASWNTPEAIRALIDASLEYEDDPRMLGHLFTTWNGYTQQVVTADYFLEGMDYWREKIE